MPYQAAESQVALSLALAIDGRSAASAEIRGLVRTARFLTAVPDPQIDPAFVARLEARLLTEGFDTPARRLHSVPTPAAAPRAFEHAANSTVPVNVIAFPQRRVVVRKAVAIAIAAAMLMALPVVASASALPGSPFYGIKKAFESMQLWLARGPVAEGFVHVSHANRRLEEVDELVAVHRTQLVAATLDSMEGSLRIGTSLILNNAADEATLLKLATMLRRSTGKLTDLFASAPPGVKSDILDALASGNALSREVAAALDAGAAGANKGSKGATTSPAGAILPRLNPQDALGSNGDVNVDGSAQAPTTPADGRDGTNKNEAVGGDATSAPCFADMYAGPGNSDVKTSVCTTVTNQDRSESADSSIPISGPFSRIPPQS